MLCFNMDLAQVLILILIWKSIGISAYQAIEPSYSYNNPCNYTRHSNWYVNLTCDTWNGERQDDDVVIKGYTIEYWLTKLPNRVYNITVNKPISSQYTVLLHSSYYYSHQVTVLVNYESNGTDVVGSRSPLLNISKEKTPDITAFSNKAYMVTQTNTIKVRSYTPKNDKLNVSYGVGLWVDDNGTHFRERELNNRYVDVDVDDDNLNSDRTVDVPVNSIFTEGTTLSKYEHNNADAYGLQFPHSVGVRRVGVKYMWTEFNGIVASTSMVFIEQNSPIVQEHRTISTSIGESIQLAVALVSIDNTMLRWKKDGSIDISEWNGMSNVTIENVRRKDDGIYECYQEGHRNEGKHAIVRVIVRECPRGKWFPPDCALDCPVCYNGGVCSEFGSCVCPPGFKGDNCEQACGINNWGRDCTILCSSGTPGCPGILYGLPDPYGCSCFTGYEGIECNNECDAGMYGPNCLLECHCDENSCDRTSGCTITATCHSGYTGERCLYRSEDVDCPDGFYGPECTKVCHCKHSSTCNRTSGSCPDGDHCAEGWAGLGCQQALPALSDAPFIETSGNNIKAYWSNWTLNNDYGRGIVKSYQLLFWSDTNTSDLSTLNITNGVEAIVSWTQVDYYTEYCFAVKVFTEIGQQLFLGEASPMKDHKIYPPSLLRPPSLLSRNSLGVNITWNEWTYAFDKGIGNVTAYIVEWWYAVSAADVGEIRCTGDTSEGILIPNITYDSILVVTIRTMYVDGSGEQKGEPSPVLVILKDNCPYDWKLLEDTCYFLDGSLLNWNDSNAFCQKQNASLVSITTQIENEYIKQLAQDKLYDYIWIGLSFQSFSRNWYWITEEILLYKNWQGTPDNAMGECAYFYTSNGFWSNRPCQSINRVMCEKGVQKFGCLDESWNGYKDECYKYFNNRTTHDEAAQSCRHFRNADLASIHSLDEDEFVESIIRNFNKDTWLGLNYSKESDLQWTDGTVVEYVINGLNQTYIDGKCAAYSQDNIFFWKFMDCSTENAYVCKDIRGNKHITNLAF
ncbi:uncharacterized protein [Antedon mediterranea]|uniref:uncharacterized protein n=1 Tax=Antedon mediterranea TaxID=105859 RepID=UPI003AF97C9B